ncbi:hypothetical protein VKT23_020229 [Stygiomarasmius scandens]|uniref:Uncharacterized protein n=1 Tax=Marasmiellus scandens TaxID=2682957 RepID=A0ABR1IM54_9AGAR
MANLPLLVLQFEIQGNIKRTEHWALAVIKNKNSNTDLFHLTGNTDSFGFARDPHNLDNSKRCLGGVVVGRVPANWLDDLERWLRVVPIKRNRSDWDCQSWVLDALRFLWENCPGVVFPDHGSERFIRDELRQEKNRESLGYELVYERM